MQRRPGRADVIRDPKPRADTNASVDQVELVPADAEIEGEVANRDVVLRIKAGLSAGALPPEAEGLGLGIFELRIEVEPLPQVQPGEVYPGFKVVPTDGVTDVALDAECHGIAPACATLGERIVGGLDMVGDGALVQRRREHQSR